MPNLNTFDQLPLPAGVARAISDMGFTEMTPIQASAIPIALAGGDLVGRSGTGTGKTVAFGIPAVLRALEHSGPGPGVLILAPTRELAVQITGELRKLTKYAEGVAIATLYGGQPMDGQIRQLKTARIVVGTPGRVMDHMRRRTLKPASVSLAILDEADEMLNMGFLEDITTILSATPESRQTLLFSATMPPAIMKITGEFQRSPQMVAADDGRRTVSTIRQHYYVVPQARKTDTLKLLLELHGSGKSVIFCNTKKMVDDLTQVLVDCGYTCAGLHGDMKQSARNAVMADFKAGRCSILIATDVAARGIDVDDIEAVFNYDIPQENEFYIHRIGRTGRAGRDGASYTIASGRAQIGKIRDIERYIGEPISEEPIPSVEALLQKRTAAFREEVRAAALAGPAPEWAALVAELAAQGVSAEQQAAALCGMLAAQDKRLAKLRAVRPFTDSERAARSRREGRTWVSVDIGSGDRIGPNFILGAIVEATTLSPKDVGRIDILRDHTLVELTPQGAAEVLGEMQTARIKGRSVTFTPAPLGEGASKERPWKEGDKRRRKPAGRPFSDEKYTKPKRRTPYGKGKNRAHQ